MKGTFRGTSRYRMVDLSTGQVVITFQAYSGVHVLESCRMACEEFNIVPESGDYRLDVLVRSVRTGKVRWSRRESFTLKTGQ